MSEILKAAQAVRVEERERMLGSNALSVSASLFKQFAPKGYDILHIAGREKARITERGMVIFTPPVLAVLLEETMTGRSRERKVAELDLPEERLRHGFSGNDFLPLITERDSDLYASFRKYMTAVKADPKWYERQIPRGGYDFPPMNEEQKTIWDKWVEDQVRIATQVPHHLRIKS